MARRTSEVPQGFQTVTVFLRFTDGARAIDSYGRAFGAEELSPVDGPDGEVGKH
jgi:uncharacterized glyoxalase superfamily protein PhnB